MITLSDFIENPSNMTDYAEWRDNPMTRVMIKFITDAYGPVGLSQTNITPERALYYSGHVDSCHGIVQMMTDLVDYVETRKRLAQMSQISPDYMANKILEESQGEV